jgi:hypothetical protein
VRLRLLLVGVAVIAVSCGQSATPVANPSVTPATSVSPTPLTRVLNVPDATPIITFGDPANHDQVDGMTWDGKLAGVLPNQERIGSGNPANNLFAGQTDIRDRSGALIASGTFGAKFFGGTWADDEVHFCQMVPFDNPGDGGVPTTLQLVAVGQAPRDVAHLGTLYNQTSVGVAACSVLADRAVVVQYTPMGSSVQYWVVRISTGQILWSRKPMPSVNVIASRDAMYVAENVSGGGGAAIRSTVYGPDGTVVAHFTQWIETFSWDGTLAVADTGYGTGPVEVISWRDGSVIWSAPPGYGLLRAKPQPDGTEFAIWVAPSSQFQQQSPTGALYVIGSTGKMIVHIANTP